MSIATQTKKSKKTATTSPVITGKHLSRKPRRANDPVPTNVELPSSAVFVPSSNVEDLVGGVQLKHETQNTHDAADAILKITVHWRLRQRWHKAEKSLILQAKALCRALVDGGDKNKGSELFDSVVDNKCEDLSVVFAVAPFIEAIENFRSKRETIEKDLAKLARKVPGYEFVKGVHGIGDGGYASLIGEAGDISMYRSVAALWKRMGLAVIEGGRQRRVADAEAALVHGYSPSRRSVMWNVGNGLIGGMGRGKRPAPGEDISEKDWTPYQKLFVERCRYECARDPDKMPLKEVEKDDELRESYPKHAQSRAKRYVEKRFLRELYAAWQKELNGA
jgi:hypothetical protein